MLKVFISKSPYLLIKNLEIEQKLKKYSKEISLNKRLLANSYNIVEIEQLEGNIRTKQSDCNNIKKENKGIRKWIKKNEKDKLSINENGFYDQEVYKLKNELRQDKAQIREIYYDNLNKRKTLIQKHESVITKENTQKAMKSLITINKKDNAQQLSKPEIPKSERAVTGKVWDVDEMKKKVTSAKTNLKREQRHIDKETLSQMDKVRELEHQVKLCSLKVKEKDKELGLAQLQIKEINRNLRHNTLRPLPSTPGNLTTRKRPNHLGYKSIDGSMVKKKKQNRFTGKRNSTDDNTRISSANGQSLK